MKRVFLFIQTKDKLTKYLIQVTEQDVTEPYNFYYLSWWTSIRLEAGPTVQIANQGEWDLSDFDIDQFELVALIPNKALHNKHPAEIIEMMHTYDNEYISGIKS